MYIQSFLFDICKVSFILLHGNVVVISRYCRIMFLCSSVAVVRFVGVEIKRKNISIIKYTNMIRKLYTLYFIIYGKSILRTRHQAFLLVAVILSIVLFNKFNYSLYSLTNIRSVNFI